MIPLPSPRKNQGAVNARLSNDSDSKKLREALVTPIVRARLAAFFESHRRADLRAIALDNDGNGVAGAAGAQ